MRDVLTFCGAGIFAAFAIMILRELRKEYTMTVILAVYVLFSLYLLPKLRETVAFIHELTVYLDNSHADCIFRALGITYLTCTASDICRSSGEPTISGYIEMAGKMEILLLCIPLLWFLL